MSFRLRWAGNTLLLFIGILLFGGGLWLSAIAPWLQRREIERIQNLPAITLASLSGLPGGQHVLIEGRISTNNPIHEMLTQEKLEKLVIYEVQYNAVGNTGWEQMTPPLLLDLPDGQIRVVNHDYIFGTLWIKWYDTTKDKSLYRGITVDTPIMVVGRVFREGNELAIWADSIDRGPRETFVREIQAQVSLLENFKPLTLLGLFIGLFIIVLSIKMAWSFIIASGKLW
jgi:hypothetical protein